MAGHKKKRKKAATGRGKVQQWLTDDGLMELAAWARDGVTYDQMAKNIGCASSTFKEWRRKYPAISAALARTCARADIEVENALFRSATGYTVKLVKQFKLKYSYVDEETGRTLEGERLVEACEDMHVPANVAAQKFWLMNRRPETWKEKQPAEDKTDTEIRVAFDEALEELSK